MSASAFASLICSKIKAAAGGDGTKFDNGTPQKCQQAIASAITEYLIAHVTVYISYAGIMNATPHPADPVVADTLKITGSCAIMSTPGTFEGWVRDLQSKIAAGFSTQPPGTAQTTTIFKPFNPAGGSLNISQDGLKSTHEGSWKDPMQKTWEIVCQGLMNWINSSAGCNPAAKGVVATRPLSTGTANLVKIVIT